MRQKGFVPVLVIVIFAILGGLGFWSYKSGIVKVSFPKYKAEDIVPSPTQCSQASPTINVSETPTPKPTNTKTVSPNPVTPSTNNAPAAPSCNLSDYDFNAATGAIQFIFNPSKGGSFYWPLMVEIKAKNSCKVLDGKSTDTIQVIKSSTSNNLSIPGIPPGSYEVRYSYHYLWVSSQTASVLSGQQTNVTFSVDNSSDP